MICYNCGFKFDAADAMSYTEDYGERFSACPNCGSSDIGDSARCEKCGEEFSPEDLADGFCMECLWESIGYEEGLAFLDDSHQLAEFLVGVWFQSEADWKHVSGEFRDFLHDVYEKIVREEVLLGRRDFLTRVREFILPKYPRYNDCNALDYAEWYATYSREHSDE